MSKFKELIFENIKWESSAFNILTDFNVKDLSYLGVNIPISYNLFKILNFKPKKILAGHLSSPKNIQRIIDLQNKKSNPISCFTDLDYAFLFNGAHGRGCVCILKGEPITGGRADVISTPIKNGNMRFISTRMFKNEDSKNFLEKIEKKISEEIQKLLKNSKNKIEIENKIFQIWDNEFKINKTKWKNILFNFKRFTSNVESVNEILLSNFSIKKIIVMPKFTIPKINTKIEIIKFNNYEDSLDFIKKELKRRHK